MKPIATKEMKDVLLPAEGTEDHVAPLPILRTEGMVSSCWKMTWKERIKAVWVGKIWFDCSGLTHPPIRIRV